MSDNKVKYLPFHAINEFMLDDYRYEVIQTVLTRFDQLESGRRGALASLVKKLVQVPGFRNSLQAPVGVKARTSVKPFQSSADYAANIVAAWCELHPDLRQQVYDLLQSRGWEVLPADADRVKLPGYLTTWPKDETFDVINQAFREKFPDAGVKDYDISLMVVWLSGRLPLDVE